jgi:hypothetical protein
MRNTYARALRDEELLPHLERGDTIIFTEAVKHWQDIEGQVERLGFGDNFGVSRTAADQLLLGYKTTSG